MSCCLIDGCDRTAVARGLCSTCYHRLRRQKALPPLERKPQPTGCSAEGCERPHAHGGYCGLHYQRLRNHGTLDAVWDEHETDADRFWSKVAKTEGCWVWKGGYRGVGYGRFWLIDGDVLPHRYSYELANGPIPTGLHIDHLCRNRGCVRPDHLEAVTQRENNLRSSGPSGVNAARTHCVNGHEFTVENTYIPPKKPNSRYCRTCAAHRSAEAAATKRR